MLFDTFLHFDQHKYFLITELIKMILHSLILFIFITNISAFNTCPEKCVCDDVKLSVICDNAGLTQCWFNFLSVCLSVWFSKFKNNLSVPIYLHPRLESLSLRNNFLDAIKPDELGIYSSLKYLDLSQNQVNEKFWRFFVNFLWIILKIIY